MNHGWEVVLPEHKRLQVAVDAAKKRDIRKLESFQQARDIPRKLRAYAS